MISLRCSAVLLLLPTLGFGCFLDETPNRDGVTVSTTASESERRAAGGATSAFMPREPNTSSARSQSVDAGPQTGDPADAAAPPQGSMDAAVQQPASMTGGTGGAAMAMAMAMDAAVRDPGTAPAVDAGTQAPHDAGAMPPTAADAGTRPAAPDPIKPIHRYDFSGNGRVAVDLIAGKDAMLTGSAYLDTRGNVQLGQSQEDAVELPSRILSGLSGFTLLGWMDLRTVDCWRRLFDFIYYREGQNRGNQSAQASALYLTPYACTDDVPRLGYVTEREQIEVDVQDELGAPRQVLLGAAYDSSTGALQLVIDGVIAAQEDAAINMRELGLARGRLGSPTDSEDRRLYGNITEFRIYDRALDAATLAEIARRGPDQL